LLTAIKSGTPTITYSITDENTSCTNSTSRQITINTTPAVHSITGDTVLCLGSTIQLENTTSGGEWSSDDHYVTQVDSSGVVYGVDAGISNIIYTIINATSGCSSFASHRITVNALPYIDVITGNTNVCIGSSIKLENVEGGVWSSSDTTLAIIDDYGITTGISQGSPTITYTITDANTGCVVSSSRVENVDPLPHLEPISGETNLCLGSTTLLSDPVSGGTWSSSNPSIASVSTSGMISGNQAGTVSITYQIDNNVNGCSNTTSEEVTVNPLPVVDITAGSATTFCQGGSVTLNAGDFKSYSWNTGEIDQSISVNSTGSYTVTVTDDNGCMNSTTTAVTVNDLPDVSITPVGATTFCQGGSVSLNAGYYTNYSWNTNASTQNITVNSSGNYTVTVTDANGCMNSASAIITVNPLPAVSSITGITSVCEGSTVQLYDATPGGLWSTNNSSLATVSTSGVITGLSAGTPTISYTVTNSITGCSNYVSKIISVNALPIVAAISGKSSVCEGSAVQLYDATPGGVWTSNNNSIAIVDSSGLVVDIAPESSVISYTVTNIITGCANSVSHIINVDPLPFVNPITGYTDVCVGCTIQLSDATPGGLWSSSDISLASVSPTGLVTGNYPGSPSIIYTVTDGTTGCSNLVFHVVTVGLYTGITSSDNSGVQIFSYSDQVFISSPRPLEGDVKIFNLLGELILAKHLSGEGTNTISLDVAPGSYIIELLSKDMSLQKKIFVQ
jgi:uncharacterized protein YjdB